MITEGASSIRAYIGPHIGAECYEFGSSDLERMSLQFGEQVVGKTAEGSPALDVAMAIAIDLERSGVEIEGISGECTACKADRYWSHRARGDHQRQALVVWVER